MLKWPGAVQSPQSGFTEPALKPFPKHDEYLILRKKNSGIMPSKC
jgi:hypothetical protein